MAEDRRIEGLQKRVAELEEQLRQLSARVESLQSGTPAVLRVRGLVVEDSKGQARFLIGAPVPTGTGRKRTDPITALVVLDEQGNDRVEVGFAPNQQVAGQIESRGTQFAGMAILDEDGNERGGFGIMDESRSAVLGIDYPGGREAVTVYAPGNGLGAGMAVHDKDFKTRLFVGYDAEEDRSVIRLPPGEELGR